MNMMLVVVRPFGTYAKGDVITDAAAIAAVQAGENVHRVVRVASQPSSAAASAAKPKQGS